MARRGLHRLIRHGGSRRKAVMLGVIGTTVALGLGATMVPLLADDDLSIPVVADTTATTVPQDGDNSVKTTLATCPARCDGNPRGAREAVLTFLVTSVPATAVRVRATLRVHAWQAFDARVTAHDSRLNARAARPAPAPLGAALDAVDGVGKGFNEWDVSALVTGNGIWTLSLAQTGLDTRIYWASAEHRNADLRPRLSISYGVGTPATSAAPSTAPTPTAVPTRVPVAASASPSVPPSVSPTPVRPSPTAPADPAGCGKVSAKLVPSCGAWWGMYTPSSAATGWDHGKVFADVEKQVGRTFDIVHRYHDFSNAGSNGAFPDAYQQQQMREGRLLFFAWESRIFSSGTVLSWKDVYSGGHDATIDAVAGRIRAIGQPVFMGFDHEPEDEPAKGSDADFVRAWRYVHDRFAAAGAGNAVWVWTMMGWSGHYDRYAGLYPGDRYVDWVAWDPYNFHVCNNSTLWKTPAATMGSFYRWLDEHGIGAGKPRMLAEFGTNFDASDPNAKRRWFEEFPAALKAHPKIKAVNYFNSPGMTRTTGTCNMTMNQDASALAGFAAAGRDAYLRQPTGGGR
ncbi:glycoside hydrolase [Micromonospora sp. WMMD1082]|uniref:glycoside hydrolase family 26 protein n=1 Tax=Micromonospora sp. WMMD1082 TaxID=3016104 RepID=UPI00241604BA|nr:glycoside hydrolase [Micromonospora sp. WMMD1082]MDG4798524.1 glycoside hydrolase [Micromonospora sp. WMMD1082]